MRNKIEGGAFAAFVSTVVPGGALLGSKLGEWYSSSEYHKYKVGDMLISRGHAVLFERRPIALVDGYRVEEREGGMYAVTMFFDKFSEEGILVLDPKTGRPERDCTAERYPKWEIENLFRRVRAGLSIDEAAAFYDRRRQ